MDCRTLPDKLLKAIGEFESKTQHRIRFRSFTVLRSPLSLAHSQFSYWHHASGLPRQLFYQVSPELLFFGDAFKLLPEDQQSEDALWCLDTETTRPGGIFLDVPLHESNSNDVCNVQHWQPLCQQAMTALVARLLQSPHRLLARQRHCHAKRLSEGIAKLNLTAVPPSATYDYFHGLLTSICPAVWLELWRETRCLVWHANRVDATIIQRGCDAIIKGAFDRLDQLSHVFFVDASPFSLHHAFDMATRGSVRERNITADSMRANVGNFHEPFIEGEMEPFNRCSQRFCASADEPSPPAMRIAEHGSRFCRWRGICEILGSRSVLSPATRDGPA